MAETDACLAGVRAAGSARAAPLDGSRSHAPARRSAKSAREQRSEGGVVMSGRRGRRRKDESPRVVAPQSRPPPPLWLTCGRMPPVFPFAALLVAHDAVEADAEPLASMARDAIFVGAAPLVI